MTTKISRIGELSLIRQIRKQFTSGSKNLITGIGDDAAVIRPFRGNLLITTDAMMEGIHFDLHFTTPYQLGFKLVSVNISDIFAMGGMPDFILLSMAINDKTEKEFLDSFFSGIQDAIKTYQVSLIGGDLSSSANGTSLCMTALGHARKPVARSGAMAGDKIYLTGPVGDSACGLELLKRLKSTVPLAAYPHNHKGNNTDSMHSIHKRLIKMNLDWDTAEPLFRRHLLPVARNPEVFVKHVSSMIDVSDGLLIDLSRLCDESRSGARIYLDKLPISTQLAKAAPCLGLFPQKLALSGGEDYELLFTAPPDKKVHGIHIGEITGNKRVIIDKSGREKPFSPEGYQHFTGIKERQ